MSQIGEIVKVCAGTVVETTFIGPYLDPDRVDI